MPTLSQQWKEACPDNPLQPNEVLYRGSNGGIIKTTRHEFNEILNAKRALRETDPHREGVRLDLFVFRLSHREVKEILPMLIKKARADALSHAFMFIVDRIRFFNQSPQGVEYAPGKLDREKYPLD